ncbi:MAG TPA: DUF2283 domain-containing protein [Polyangia bacterium]|nr:DUF2283 domain-containing protein [Polyangia bacterium]
MKTRAMRPDLEVTFRKGRAFAAYLYLAPAKGVRVARSSERAHGLVVDYATDGEPLGIEIIAPSRVELEELNAILRELHAEELATKDLAPLIAARA